MQCKLEIKDRRQVQIGRRIIKETETYEEAKDRYNKECQYQQSKQSKSQLAAAAAAAQSSSSSSSPDFFESMFTDDFSKSSPFLHSLLVC